MSETLAAETAESQEDTVKTEADTTEEAVVEGESAEEKETEASEELSPKEIMRLASQRGWMPRKYFKGDPDNFIEPEQYLERAENEMPILKATLRKIERDNKDLRGLMKRLVQLNNAQTAQAVKKVVSELKGKRDEAISNADVDGAKKYDDEIDEVKASAQKENGQDTEARVANAPDPEAVAWAEKNPWFKTDAKMRAYVYGVWEEIEMNPLNAEMGTKDKLRIVLKDVKSRFPEKFSNPRRREAATVEGGTGTVKPKGRSFDDLPADAKEVCNDLVRQKILSKAEYVKSYQW